MATFARHHPGWRLVLGSPDLERAPDGVELERDTVTSSALPPAARSDVWRWWALQRGGWWSDCDVLYLRSVEPLLVGDHDAWVTTDGGTRFAGARKWWEPSPFGKRLHWEGLSIGAIGTRDGSEFAIRALKVATAGRGTGYQAHGTEALAAEWPSLSRGLSLGPLPFRFFYFGSSAPQVRALWLPAAWPHPEAFGLHWYGGSPESRPFLGAKSVDDLPACAVRRCLVP